METSRVVAPPSPALLVHKGISPAKLPLHFQKENPPLKPHFELVVLDNPSSDSKVLLEDDMPVYREPAIIEKRILVIHPRPRAKGSQYAMEPRKLPARTRSATNFFGHDIIEILKFVHVACSYLAKMSPNLPTHFLGKNAPAPQSAETGEDSFTFSFLQPGSKRKSCLIGVLDGVGGWRMRNIDSGVMARGLATRAKEAHQRGLESPKAIMKEAYDVIINNKEIVGGSTTACFIVFSVNDQGYLVLNSANIGDSAFKVFRGELKKELIFQSKLQRHGDGGRFSPPFQLAALGEEFKHLPVCNDLPKDAEEVKDLVLLPGDIVVLATDGVYDNMTQQDLEFIVSNTNTTAEEKADEIVNTAVRNNWKVDDVTCTVTMIRPYDFVLPQTPPKSSKVPKAPSIEPLASQPSPSPMPIEYSVAPSPGLPIQHLRIAETVTDIGSNVPSHDPSSASPATMSGLTTGSSGIDGMVVSQTSSEASEKEAAASRVITRQTGQKRKFNPESLS